MKKLRLLTAVFTVVITFFCNSMIAQDVLWYGDPNKSVKSSFRRFDAGNFPKDYCNDQSNNSSSVGTVNDSKYGKVWRIRKPKGQKRGEFARTTGTSNSYTPKDGDLVYYGWRWKIESNPNINNGIAVWQWKTDGGSANNTQNYPLNMGYGNGTLTLSAWGPCYPKWNSCSGSISKRKTTLWSKSIPEDTWVSFVVGIKMSRNDNVGYVELWYNGEKQILKNSGFQDYTVDLSSDKKRAYHKTYDGTVMYPKWGAYNSNACKFDTTTYYDEMRIGKTLSSVLDPLGGSNDGAPNQAPNISFQSPTGNITVNEGYNLEVEANASDPDGSISNVKLFINNSLIREEKKAPYEWGHANSPNPNELNGRGPGTYTVKAVATDNEGKTAQKTFTLTVVGDDPGNQSPIVSFDTPNGNLTVNPGYSLTAVVNASDPDGSINNVKLYINNSLVRQESIAPYEWGHSGSPNPNELNNLGVGTYTIKAIATDNDGGTGQVSFQLTVTSNNPDPTVDGATVASTTNQTNIITTTGDGIADVITFQNTSAASASYRYLITDADGNILTTENSSHDFEGASVGICLVYGISYTGNLSIAGKNVSDGGLATGTFDVSSNSIIVDRRSEIVNPPGDCDFGTPVSQGIIAKDKVTYNKVYILGSGGPDLGNFRKFTINWVPSQNGLYQFAINTNNGSPSWYVDFKESMSYQLRNSNPEVTLNNTGFNGLDGSYWIAETSNSMILVSKTKGYSIHFSNASSAPSCSNKTPTLSSVSELKATRNPFTDVLTLSGIPKDAFQAVMYDYSGKKIVQHTILDSVVEITMDTSSLSSGMYFVKVFSEGTPSTIIKVLKQ